MPWSRSGNCAPRTFGRTQEEQGRDPYEPDDETTAAARKRREEKKANAERPLLGSESAKS